MSVKIKGYLVTLRSWLGFGANDLKSQSWKKLREYCEASKKEFYDVLGELTAKQFVLSGCETLIPRFKLLENELQKLKNLKGRALVDSLFPQRNGSGLRFVI